MVGGAVIAVLVACVILFATRGRGSVVANDCGNFYNAVQLIDDIYVVNDNEEKIAFLDRLNTAWLECSNTTELANEINDEIQFLMAQAEYLKNELGYDDLKIIFDKNGREEMLAEYQAVYESMAEMSDLANNYLILLDAKGENLANAFGAEDVESESMYYELAQDVTREAWLYVLKVKNDLRENAEMLRGTEIK